MIETDALIIGAGPAGLWTAFELGLLGISAHLVDALEEAGGQCVELYGDKPIYDIPAVPRCSGRELTQSLLKQIAAFTPIFHFGQQVESLARQSDTRWRLTTCKQFRTQHSFLARTVFIAAGVGAFVPKELKINGLSEFLGRQLFYQIAPTQDFSQQAVLLVGGADAAVNQAIALAELCQARSVTLVHRRDVLQASSVALARLAELRAAGRVRFVAGQVISIQTSGQGQGKRLSAVEVATPEGQTLKLALDTLLVCQGLHPKLGTVSDWGLAMERKQLSVNPVNFATSAPGIFAVGDIITYPGKKKLILSAFHEATLAAFAAAAQLRPEQSEVLQYSTSSALLQARLGVARS